MSVTVPAVMPSQIGPCSMIYKTPCNIETKSPPKTLPKRKPGNRDNHIYDRVPREGSLFKQSYSPVIYQPKQIPGKLSPHLLNLLTKKTQESSFGKKTEEKPTDKPALKTPDPVITITLCKPTQAVKPTDDKPTEVAKNKANRQGCPNLEEQIKPSAEASKPASNQEEGPGSQKGEVVADESSPQGNIKCQESDGCMPSLLENSLSKEQDADTTKTETASMFSSDLRSTTCSASSAFSSTSSSSSSSTSSSPASSSTLSESSDSSMAKAFFSTPNLGSSTPKRINSPKNFTPVENLYDSWRMDIAAKAEANTATTKSENPAKQLNKCSGYYAEISEYMPTGSAESPSSVAAEKQAGCVPSTSKFCNNIHREKEHVLYVNLPTRTPYVSSLSKQSLKGRNEEIVIVNQYVDPKDELMDAPQGTVDGAVSANTNAQANNPYETPLDIGTTGTQTEVVAVSCGCGELLYLPTEMEEVVAQLKHEQNMRLVSEQLVKMVEIEVKELKEDLLAKKTQLLQVMEEKQSAEGELREATKIAGQYKVDIGDLEKSLAQANEEITRLKDRVSADVSSDSGSKNDDTDSDLERKLAEAKDTEAKNRLEVVQAELLASKDEVNRLLAHLAQATREKSDMVSTKVHKELLRMSEDRAHRAEMKNLALERELRILMEQRFFSGAPTPSPGDAPKIPPRKSEVKYPASSIRASSIRTSPKHFQKNSTLYVRGNMAAKRIPQNGGRTTAGAALGNKRTKTQSRSWSLSKLRKVEASKEEKGAKTEDVKEVKSSGKVSFLQRVQSRVASSQAKTEVQKSLFDRMQTRFFTKSAKSTVPASNCDLPDVDSLEETSTKSEYEVPMEPVQRFARTPLMGKSLTHLLVSPNLESSSRRCQKFAGNGTD